MWHIKALYVNSGWRPDSCLWPNCYRREQWIFLGRNSFRPIFEKKKPKKKNKQQDSESQSYDSSVCCCRRAKFSNWVKANEKHRLLLPRRPLRCEHMGDLLGSSKFRMCVIWGEWKPKRSRFHSAVLGQIKEKEIFKHKAFKKKKKCLQSVLC